MENQDKVNDSQPTTNEPGTGVLVSVQTEDVTVDAGEIDRQQAGVGEENRGDDFLGRENKRRE
ncbi:MAG: hypothetical protein H7Z72_04465 [Bacteroidetes bacterium]|nr:hypothetical protein [Fibrella sp.]